MPYLEQSRQVAQLAISQAEKKPVLILTVYPSLAPYNFSEQVGPKTTIRRVENLTLVFAPKEGEIWHETFHVFLSNVGTVPTVAQYLFADAIYGGCSQSSTRVLNSTILRPEQSAEWTVTFEMTYGCVKTSTQDVRGTMWFSVMTTDGTVTKVVEFVVKVQH